MSVHAVNAINGVTSGSGVWRAVSDGWRELGRTRAATLAALLASVASALAVAAAFGRARLDLRAAWSGDLRALGHAAFVVAVGLAVATLVADQGRCSALAAFSAPTSAVGRLRWLVDGAVRLPAVVSIGFIEWTVVGCLGLAALQLGAILDGPTAGRGALAWAAAAAPLALLSLVTIAAARVAVLLAARGAPPARAWIAGCDFVLRHAPSLLRLGAALSLVTAPLGGVAVLVLVLRPNAAGAAAALALVELGVLWSYASLAALVGRDARLGLG